jgi:hypothetical protein
VPLRLPSHSVQAWVVGTRSLSASEGWITLGLAEFPWRSSSTATTGSPRSKNDDGSRRGTRARPARLPARGEFGTRQAYDGLLEERRILYEREARTFAAELLMPFFEVWKRWFAISQEHPVEGELSAEGRMQRLAAECGVTPAGMRVRLQ